MSRSYEGSIERPNFIEVLNDRKPCTVETWADDSGKLAHLALVQDPGKPLKLYYNGVALELPR